MITKNDLEQLNQYFQMLDKQRKILEDNAIISVLRSLGLPAHKSDSMMGIPDFIEKDNIYIWMPKSVYATIDFSKLSIPNRLTFTMNPFEDEWKIIGVNNLNKDRIEIKFGNKT